MPYLQSLLFNQYLKFYNLIIKFKVDSESLLFNFIFHETD